MSIDQTLLGAKILVVDDEAGIRYFLEETLTEDGHCVVAVASGEEALERIAKETFDLALLDLKMKGIGGLEVLAVLRQQSPATVAIVLTAHASLDTAVEALRQGAHDYLFKPCETAELRASIQMGLVKRRQQLRQQETLAHLEHSLRMSLEEIHETTAPRGAEVPPSTLLHPTQDAAGQTPPPTQSVVVDAVRQTVTVDGHVLDLSPTEFALLAYLADQAPRVISPQELVSHAQGYQSEAWEAREILRSHISNLRHKIEAATGRGDVIRTVRSKGYAIERSSG